MSRIAGQKATGDTMKIQFLTKAGGKHDVSGEKRDARGEWTSDKGLTNLLRAVEVAFAKMESAQQTLHQTEETLRRYRRKGIHCDSHKLIYLEVQHRKAKTSYWEAEQAYVDADVRHHKALKKVDSGG